MVVRRGVIDMEPNRLVPVVTRPARPCRHGLHSVLALLTLGLWVPFWALDAALARWHPARQAKIEYR